MFVHKLDNDRFVVTTDKSHGTTGTVVQALNLFKNFPVQNAFMSNKSNLNKDLKKIEILLKTFTICLSQIKSTLKVDGKVLFGVII